ncbi:hypothetical protein P4679_27155 [Priestia megaterium]|uniref:hypothetical protein n=1 Tax=Priestia megaterium TaxID=1404 RepID=UPI002E1B1BAA|nr:hypothetical protein [Priestia megaterium]
MSAFINNQQDNSKVEMSRWNSNITFEFEDLQYSGSSDSEDIYDGNIIRQLTFDFEELKNYVNAVIRVKTLEFSINVSDSFGCIKVVPITSNEENATVIFEVDSINLVFNEFELATVMDTLIAH